jgi:dCTP diphosphatase
MNMQDIQQALKQFFSERDWDQFHSPKNLVMSLSNEMGELIELFQWLTEEQSRRIMLDPALSQQVREEMADVFLNLLSLADSLKVDLCAAAVEKMAANGAKYPIEKAKSLAKKYIDL